MYEITDGRPAEMGLDCVCQELEIFIFSIFFFFLVKYDAMSNAQNG